MKLDDINDVREWADKMTDAVDSAFLRKEAGEEIPPEGVDAEIRAINKEVA
jgi:hypothetical protein